MMPMNDKVKNPRVSLFSVLGDEQSQWSGWQPRADLYRCGDKLLVKLEIAGVAYEDIRIYVRQDTLIVEGRRRDRSVSDTTEFLSMEISYDYFKRLLRLPAPVDAERIETDYRDGMLLIYLPYSERGSA